jgi:hypothetical protein
MNPKTCGNLNDGNSSGIRSGTKSKHRHCSITASSGERLLQLVFPVVPHHDYASHQSLRFTCGMKHRHDWGRLLGY